MMGKNNNTGSINNETEPWEDREIANKKLEKK